MPRFAVLLAGRTGCHWRLIRQCERLGCDIFTRDINSPIALAGKQPVAPHCAGRTLRRIGNSRRSCHERGAFLVVALICLVLATALVGTVLLAVQSQGRQLTQHQSRLQAEWLAESGLERAASRLRSDGAYAGEIWKLTGPALGGTDGGEVQIRVQPSFERATGKLVHVEAVFPAGSTQPVRRTRQTTIILFEES